MLIQYIGIDWFNKACSYASARYNAVSKRLIDTFRYVELHNDNRLVYSYEYSSILRDCGSIFSSVMDALVRGSKFTISKKITDFGDYKRFLLSEIPDLNFKSLKLRYSSTGLLIPFYKINETPLWWTAYNKVKHNEHNMFCEGNLENCVNFVGGIALIGFEMKWFLSDQLFCNLGLKYHPSTQDDSFLMFHLNNFNQ
jgi:hypothetical protein